MATWKEDLNYGLQAFGLKLPDSIPIDEMAASLVNSPARNTLGLLLSSSAAFYAAEREHNPKVRDIYDALIYCSTCLSVGYSDIFAKTPVGKLIGTMLMTIGPSMTAAVTDGRHVETAKIESDMRREVTQQEILITLEKVLEELRASKPSQEDNDVTRN